MYSKYPLGPGLTGDSPGAAGVLGEEPAQAGAPVETSSAANTEAPTRAPRVSAAPHPGSRARGLVNMSKGEDEHVAESPNHQRRRRPPWHPAGGERSSASWGHGPVTMLYSTLAV